MTGTTKPSGIPWIGEIPVDWETDEIRYKFKQVKTLNFRGDEDNLLSLSYGRIIQKDIESAFGLLPESFDTYNIIENGDIVLRLTDLQNDQKSLRVGFSKQRGIITSAYLTLRLASEGHAKFFYYLIHAYDLQKVFYGMGAGVRQGLNWDELKRLSVIIPNIVEQQAIADFLDEECGKIDAVATDMEKQIEILRQHRKSLICEVIAKGLKETKLKESKILYYKAIPENWEIRRIKYCIESRQSGEWGEEESENMQNIDCIRVADFDYENLSLQDKEYTKRGYTATQVKKYKLEKGDLLFEKSGGGDLSPVGRSVIFNKDIEALYANFIEAVRIKQGYSSRFFNYIFAMLYISGVNKLHYTQTIGIQNIRLQSYFDESVAIPPLDEQQAIADYLDEKCAKIDAIIKDKQAAVDTMREYKKSLIYEYVTGKKRVKEAQ